MQSGSSCLFSPMSVSAAGTYGTVGAAGGFIRVNGNPMEQPGDKVIPPGSPYPPPGPTGNLHNHVGACSGATANRELQVLVPTLIYFFFFTLFEKSNFCPKIQFWQKTTFSRVFPPNFLWQFFSWNQSCQQLKSPKQQHFQ